MRDRYQQSLDSLHAETRPAHELFLARFFTEAVRLAAQRYVNRVADMIGPEELERRGQPPNLTGTRLIDLAFGGNDPVIRLGGQATRSKRSERDGYHQLARGLTLALRNVLSHDDEYAFDEAEAVECLAFISAMHRRLDRTERLERLRDADPVADDAAS